MIPMNRPISNNHVQYSQNGIQRRLVGYRTMVQEIPQVQRNFAKSNLNAMVQQHNALKIPYSLPDPRVPSG